MSRDCAPSLSDKFGTRAFHSPSALPWSRAGPGLRSLHSAGSACRRALAAKLAAAPGVALEWRRGSKCARGVRGGALGVAAGTSGAPQGCKGAEGLAGPRGRLELYKIKCACVEVGWGRFPLTGGPNVARHKRCDGTDGHVTVTMPHGSQCNWQGAIRIKHGTAPPRSVRTGSCSGTVEKMGDMQMHSGPAEE